MKYFAVIALSLFSSNLWAAARVATIPEPETLFLFGIGVVALILSRNKRK